MVTLHAFTPAEGVDTYGLSLASDGLLYGATAYGVAGGGSIYRFSPGGALPALDTDADGLPNDWEIQFGLNPSSAIGDDGPNGDADGDGRTTLQEYQAGTHPRGVITRYFAEGATGSFFRTRFALLNPRPRPAIVLCRFLRHDGVTVRHLIRLPAQTRATLDPAAIAGLENATFSTVIEGDVH